jgi:hypothetical protein
MPVHKDLGAALLFDYANLGSVQGTRVGSDGYVYPTETYQPRGFRVGGGFGKKWGAFGVGAALHGGFESGFTENQGGLLWGTGLAFRPIRGPWLAGLYVQGSSGPASGDSHSLEFRPALAAHFEKGAHSSFLGTVEGSFGGDNPKGSFKFGGEYAYLTKYFVRCGYRWYADSSELAGLRGISGGLGWRSNTWALNYALTTLGTLGVGHQLSLQVYFKRNETKAGVPVTPLKKKGSAKTVSPTETPTPLPTMVETSSPTSGAEETQSSSESEMLDWYRKGMTAYHNQRYGQAFMDLEKAVGIQDPSVKDFYYAEAYATLGALYQHHRTGEDHLDQARKCYLRALKKDPDTENAKKGLQELDEATQKQDLRK